MLLWVFVALGSTGPRPDWARASGTVAPKRPAAAAGCSRFAAETGSDAGPGTFKRPYRSAQRLLRSLHRGQVGCLRRGIYRASGEYVLDVSRPDVSIMSYPGERAVLRGTVVVRAGADRVHVSRVTIEGAGVSNTVKVYAADFVLEGSDVTNSWRGWTCLILGSKEGGPATRPVIRGNRFHECGNPAAGNQDHGIYADLVSNGLITRNVFYNIAAYAIQLYPHAQRMTVSYNVIDGGPPSIRGGVVIGAESDGAASSNNVVRNNIIAYAATYSVATYWGGKPGSGNVARANCFYQAGAGFVATGDGLTAENNVVADPLFVDRSAHNYRLRPGSRCRAMVRLVSPK